MDRGDKRDSTEQAGWVVTANQQTPNNAQPSAQTARPQSSGDMVEWTASEYIAHQKSAAWYVKVIFFALLLACLVYFITRDVISTFVILFAGLVFSVAGARKPRTLAYRLDQGGLTVGQKYYPYSQFKSFAVVEQGPLTTVMLLPLKRLLPSVDIYAPPENVQAIGDILTEHLPLEVRKPGVVDTFAHRIRF
ncbi:MAG TPA: hypothetical protein VFB59_00290 [Candidatus Saccharimonadales bacterium]|nr:hypothetical protein [Candidatus Saccharimonadales bacterium]